MASIAEKEETMSIRHGGVASYRIKGQLFRGIGSIQNAAGSTPRLIQTYFFDNEEQATLCTAFLDRGNEEENARNLQLFQQLHQMLLDSGNTSPLSSPLMNTYKECRYLQKIFTFLFMLIDNHLQNTVGIQ
jgi:hypothetical protein